jgi:excisionase family DNA binding protein
MAYLSPKKASSLLGVCPKTLRRWAKQHKIEFALTPGGHHRYDVDRYLQQHRQS